MSRISRKQRKRLGWLAEAVVRHPAEPGSSPKRTRAERALAGDAEFSGVSDAPKPRIVLEPKDKDPLPVPSGHLYEGDDDDRKS